MHPSIPISDLPPGARMSDIDGDRECVWCNEPLRLIGDEDGLCKWCRQVDKVDDEKSE